MTNYKKFYFMLLNGISEVTEQLEQFSEMLIKARIEKEKIAKLQQCISSLKRFQIESENAFISQDE